MSQAGLNNVNSVPIFFVQQLRASTSTNLTGSTIIPQNSTPQNTDGTQILTVTITPKSATNILCIEFTIWGFITGPNQFFLIGAVFQDSTVNTLYATMSGAPSGFPVMVPGKFYMTAGTTSATTFNLRVGCDEAASTWSINGNASLTSNFGGHTQSSFTVSEFIA